MDAVDRAFRRLVSVIRSQFPELLTRPFEVAELYQTILPYRHHRKEMGVETNQDYELVLLELLSGARGYLLGDDEMQDALRRELESPNPDTGAFRVWAHSHVSLAPEGVRQLDGDAHASGGRAAESVPGLRGPGGPSAAPAAPRQAPPPPNPAPPSSIARAAARGAPSAVAPRSPQPERSEMASEQRFVTANTLGGECRYCGGALPEGRRLAYCPHCGQNLTVQHCPACSTELEVGWKFCTTCGRSVA